MSYEEALHRIEQAICPLTTSEQVPLRDALGRILAEEVVSHHNVSPYANSAMDGYAVSGADLPATGSRTLTLVGTSFAGKPY
ncbi:MAG: molybdopterin molybdenumtransferase MoeA, partial [Beggiatoa sp. IS2]